MDDEDDATGPSGYPDRPRDTAFLVLWSADGACNGRTHRSIRLDSLEDSRMLVDDGDDDDAHPTGNSFDADGTDCIRAAVVVVARPLQMVQYPYASNCDDMLGIDCRA